MNRALRIPARRMTLIHMGAALLTLLWLAWLAALMTPLAPPADTLRLRAAAVVPDAAVGPARTELALTQRGQRGPRGSGAEARP